MARRDGFWLALHDLQMHQDFARPTLRARELVAFKIHEAHILGLHEAFAHERGRAERDVFADTNRDVAAIAVNVSAAPQAAANIAKLPEGR